MYVCRTHVRALNTCKRRVLREARALLLHGIREERRQMLAEGPYPVVANSRMCHMRRMSYAPTLLLKL